MGEGERGVLEIAKSQIVGLIKDTFNTNQVDDVDLLEKDYDDKEDIFENVLDEGVDILEKVAYAHIDISAKVFDEV